MFSLDVFGAKMPLNGSHQNKKNDEDLHIKYSVMGKIFFSMLEGETQSDSSSGCAK
jgi:hypothetical protein